MKVYAVPAPWFLVVALCNVASASAWSCGPNQRVIGNRYSVGCRPNEICQPPGMDFLTLPEIQAMLRRNRKQQRYFYSPFVEEFRYSMDRPFGSSTFPPWKSRSNGKSKPSNMSPRYEITETESAVQIEIDVPGLEMKDIRILLDEPAKVLTVSGSRESTAATSRDGVEERGSETSKSSRAFSQKFVLRNPTIDSNRISAALENGVLTISLPKIPPKEEVAEINVRQIPIMDTTNSATATNPIINDDTNQKVTDDADRPVADSVVTMSEPQDHPPDDENMDETGSAGDMSNDDNE